MSFRVHSITTRKIYNKRGKEREPAIELFRLIESICIGLAALGGGVAIIVKCVKNINDNHDRVQKYDNYDERIKDLSKKYDALEKKFEDQFEELQEEIQTNIDSNFHQIQKELCLLSYCVGATLDGLKQLNCNGKVSEAKEKMDKHLNQQAHGEI